MLGNDSSCHPIHTPQKRLARGVHETICAMTNAFSSKKFMVTKLHRKLLSSGKLYVFMTAIKNLGHTNNYFTLALLQFIFVSMHCGIFFLFLFYFCDLICSQICTMHEMHSICKPIKQNSPYSDQTQQTD